SSRTSKITDQMSAKTVDISCPDDVQVWDIDLDELIAVAVMAAEALSWGSQGLSPAQEKVLTEIWPYCDELPITGRAPFEQVGKFLAGEPGKRTGLALEALQLA